MHVIKTVIRRNKFLFTFYTLLAFFLSTFFLLLHSDFSHKYIAKYHPDITAFLVGKTLIIFGETPLVFGGNVSLRGFSYTINYHCSAIFAVLIFSSAVLSFPAKLKEKGVGLLFGIIILEGVNITRLTVLAFIGSRVPKLFDFFHEYLWQAIIIVFVVLLWLSWISFFVTKKPGSS